MGHVSQSLQYTANSIEVVPEDQNHKTAKPRPVSAESMINLHTICRAVARVYNWGGGCEYYTIIVIYQNVIYTKYRDIYKIS